MLQVCGDGRGRQPGSGECQPQYRHCNTLLTGATPISSSKRDITVAGHSRSISSVINLLLGAELWKGKKSIQH